MTEVHGTVVVTNALVVRIRFVVGASHCRVCSEEKAPYLTCELFRVV